MNIKELYKAIYSRYADGAPGAALRDVTTGMFQEGGVPQGTSYPFVTYDIVSSTQEWTNKSSMDMPLIDFTAWDSQHDNADRVLEIADLVKSLYVDAILVVVGSAMIRADLLSENIIDDPDDKGFEYAVSIRYTIQTER